MREGKVVFRDCGVWAIIQDMLSNNVLPECSEIITRYGRNVPRSSKIIVDLKENKLICSFRNGYGAFYEYVSYVYDLDKINFEKFFEEMLNALWVESFEIILKKILANEYLRMKFHKALENSPKLIHYLKSRYYESTEIAKKYDKVLLAKLLL